MNGTSSWIEPPPRDRGLGCLAKGCLILVVFVICLGFAFVGGIYYGHHLRTEYLSAEHEKLPISQATVDQEQAVRARWDHFRKAARAHEDATIELSADDINALIASDSKLHGNAYVTIDDSTAHLQLSIRLGAGARWLLQRSFLNAKCSIQAAPSGQPDDARITNIVVNGQPVGEEFVSWQYGDWPSAKRWIADWVLQNNLKRFEISDGKVILETSGPNKDPFSSESPAEEESPTATLTATVTPTPSDAPR